MTGIADRVGKPNEKGELKHEELLDKSKERVLPAEGDTSEELSSLRASIMLGLTDLADIKDKKLVKKSIYFIGRIAQIIACTALLYLLASILRASFNVEKFAASLNDIGPYSFAISFLFGIIGTTILCFNSYISHKRPLERVNKSLSVIKSLRQHSSLSGNISHDDFLKAYKEVLKHERKLIKQGAFFSAIMCILEILGSIACLIGSSLDIMDGFFGTSFSSNKTLLPGGITVSIESIGSLCFVISAVFTLAAITMFMNYKKQKVNGEYAKLGAQIDKKTSALNYTYAATTIPIVNICVLTVGILIMGTGKIMASTIPLSDHTLYPVAMTLRIVGTLILTAFFAITLYQTLIAPDERPTNRVKLEAELNESETQANARSKHSDYIGIFLDIVEIGQINHSLKK